MTDTPPRPPNSLPKYLAEGLPKQDTETLEDVRAYVDELLEHQPSNEADLPDGAELGDEHDDARGRSSGRSSQNM